MKQLVLTFMLMSLVACSNTMEGISKDSKPVGDAVNEAAETIKKTIHEATE